MFHVQVHSPYTQGQWQTIGTYTTEVEAEVRMKYEKKRNKKQPFTYRIQKD